MKIIILILLPLILFAEDSLKTYKLNPVVVTGTRTKQQKSEISSSISVIDNYQIRQSEETNILPLIGNLVPGVFIEERNTVGYGIAGGSAGSISIRGVSGSPNTRVLVLIDGQPQFMGIFGHPIVDSYTTSDIEKVEVIRGPASILYGSNAMSGAVNIITNTQNKDGFSLKSNFSAGSFDTYTGNLSGGFKSGNFSVFATYNNNQTSGFRDNRNDSYYTNTGYLKSNYNINKNLNITIDANISDSRFYDPGSIYSESAPADFRRDYLRGRASVSFFNNYKNIDGAFRGFYNFGEHNFSNTFNSNDFNSGITFYQNLKFLKNNIITIGTDIKTYGGKAENDFLDIPLVNESINETEFYSFIQQKLINKLNLSAGYRFTNNSKFGEHHTPYGGLKYDVFKNTSVKLAVSKGFRSPTLMDLFMFGINNDELEPEKLINYEIGINQYLFNHQLFIELTSFYIEGDNLIQVAPVNGSPKKINSGEFIRKGIEITSKYFVTNDLFFNLNYSFIDSDKPSLLAPKHNLNINSTYQYKFLQFSAGLKFIDELYINTELNKSESYINLYSKISAEIINGISIYFKANNLTDENYMIDYGYPMPGITGFIGIKYSYN